MRVIDSATRKNMHFKGQFNAEGFVISAPVASVSNIAPVMPLTVRRQALAQHPDIKYWYDVKPVDRNTIELTNHIHSITRSGDTLSSVNLDVEQVKLTLSRVGGLPDLNLVAFTTELKGSGNSAYRILRATVENSGDADLAKEYLIKIWYYTKDISPDPGPPWRTVSYTPSLRPPLRKGERTVVEWRTDTKTETGGTPFLPDDAVVMKAEVDPDLDIKESVETNNYRMLHKICVPPDAPENTGGNKEDWVDRGEMTLDEMAKQVLCHIKREAKELAREDKGTVRDSRFLAYLRTAYLRKYLARPTIQSAKEMIEEIGKPVVKLETLAGALDHRLFVPAAFRQKYAGKVPEYLYVATDVLNQLNTPKSKILKGETVLDVSFLLGKENYGAEDLSDWQNGGKNWSNVMHWATGLKYYDLPPTAM
ncbi:MAG TPA: hypothetical protein VK862_05940, partial [Afifellaceae bacterium]|nr:hypothetical protein [Afifellaceae bacterium]